jgi:glutamine amidotransferase
MSRVAVVDYDMGNLRSIANALRAVGADVAVVRDADQVAAHDRVVLPGVGAYGAAMDRLRAAGLDEALHTHVCAGRPLFGICIGFQVLFARGLEHGESTGLGVFDGTVARFETDMHVPHVGWNAFDTRPHPLWTGLPHRPHVYFVHSYHPVGVDDEIVIGEAEYGNRFACAVARDNVAGTQFHPEKSGPIGLTILANALEWSP